MSRRIDRLLREYRFGPAKYVMTDPDYPPDQPHCGPGIYFIVAVPDRFSGAVPERAKIGKSSDVRLRLANLQTGNPAHLHLAHAIYEPDADRRHAIEANLHHRFRHLRVNGEWFRWTDELHEYVYNRCSKEYYL
ncbi:GIY-YIG nuclease family protein [Micromonospora musae]|uniref:GIY-YIG nuclease family protein n=1 Tax=Micromonospora musae TaxID=1894970 RepID=UPI0033FA503B